jgi:hypothetical protein
LRPETEQYGKTQRGFSLIENHHDGPGLAYAAEQLPIVEGYALDLDIKPLQQKLR